MIEKIKSVYKFKNAAEITDTLNALNSQQRPYQYAFLDSETNPIMMEIKKINKSIEAIVGRIDSIEKSQKDIRDALSLICNQTQLRQVSSHQTPRGRNSDYHT